MSNIQPRLKFPTPNAHVRVVFALSGLRVLVEVVEGSTAHALEHLTAAGVVVSVDKDLMAFPVRHLALLANLPEHVIVDVDHWLNPLWTLATNQPTQAPAVIEVVVGDLRLSWRENHTRFDVVFLPAAVGALLASELPFVASQEAWLLLISSSTLPVTVARAKITDDGFIEIVASKPQLVEAAPISGMFKIDDTRYGVPVAYLDEVLRAPGFVFESQHPKKLALPQVLVPELASSSRQTATELVMRLLSLHSAILIAPPGGSRRVAVSSALKAVGVSTILVVCAPWALWPWKQALRMTGFDPGMSDRSLVRLVTYNELSAQPTFEPTDAVVFDDVALMPQNLRASCARLDTLGKYRVVISSLWPEPLSEQIGIAAHARPVEFRADVPLALRYPLAPDKRAFEHIRPYLVRSGRTPGTFPRLTVELLKLSPTLEADIANLGNVASMETFNKTVELVSCGSSSVMSAKLSAALERLQHSQSLGRRCVVLCRHKRFATMLSAISRPLVVPLLFGYTAKAPENGSCVVVFDDLLPDLAFADDVVLVDWPLTMSVLEEALGATFHASVLITHVPGTVDDNLAIRACLSPSLAPITSSELPWLLHSAPRIITR